MSKMQNMIQYWIENPNASVGEVVKKFKTSSGYAYLAKSKAKPKKIVLNPTQVAVAKKLGIPLSEYAKGVMEFEEETETFPGQEEDTVDAILDARAVNYGLFSEGAALMQGMKRLMAEHARKHNKTFTDSQWEALEMIVHKIARIVNGNPEHVDSWLDIAGYAELIADELEGNFR